MCRVVKIVWSCEISLVANDGILYMGWHRTVGSLGSKIKVGDNLVVPTIISQ